MDADPGCRRFRQQGALRQGGCIDSHQIERLLVARLALVDQRLAVRAPVGAHQVDVRVRAQIHLALRARFRRDDQQLHQHVRVAGGRVALLDDVGAVGEDFEAAHDGHRCFVIAFVGDGGIVGRPVVAGALAHFFLRHEFGFAVADRALSIRGELAFLVRLEVDHIDVLIAHKRHVAAFRRNFRVQHIALGDQARLVRVGRVDQVQIAGQRHQQLLAIGRPAVAENAVQAGRALAFAARLLFGRNRFIRHQRLRVDQAVRALVLQLEFPQVELELVVGAAAQERDALAVGRDLQVAHAGAGQRRIGMDAFQGQLFSRCGNAGHRGQKTKNKTHGCLGDGKGMVKQMLDGKRYQSTAFNAIGPATE